MRERERERERETDRERDTVSVITDTAGSSVCWLPYTHSYTCMSLPLQTSRDNGVVIIWYVSEV